MLSCYKGFICCKVLVCLFVLLDKHMGQRELLFLEKELGFHDQKASIGYVCSSQVYDLLFQSVRLLLKSGLEPTEVQAILDKEMHISGVNA